MGNIPNKGWVIHVKRIRMEQRKGKSFARTVVSYQVHRDGTPVAALAGTTVERQGPSDNGPSGHKNHNRIATGTYALLTFITKKYAITGDKSDGSRARPCIGVEPRGSRSAVLIHPAGEYGSTIGCINLSGPLAGPRNNISLSDSVARVAALVENLRAYAGKSFPKSLEASIPDAWLMVED